MYTIEFKDPTGAHQRQEVNVRTRSLIAMYLTTFPYDIVAVYEQTTPITKAMRKELSRVHHLSDAASRFVNSPA